MRYYDIIVWDGSLQITAVTCNEKKFKKTSEKYVFFDFETKLVNNHHIINYCIAQYCDGAENIFTNIDDFCIWALSKEHKGYTFIAHYGKGYDFQFAHEWLIQIGRAHV